MAVLEDKIKKFLRVDIGSGFGFGDGSGSGYGYGSGFGDGSGSGFGSGDGDGYGDGSGSGYGYGSGYGSGSGFGSGSGDGDGYGDGNNSSIKMIDGYKVYKIDEVPTIILSIHNNIAKGKILNRDLTFQDCYVAKGHNLFAHGETIKKAVEDLQNKIINNLDTEERIEEFRKYFNNTDKYKGTEFYKWHNLLTGSCEMGRNAFVSNHNINLENTFTVKEFIKLCKNDYGGEIIRKLEKEYKEEN